MRNAPQPISNQLRSEQFARVVHTSPGNRVAVHSLTPRRNFLILRFLCQLSTTKSVQCKKFLRHISALGILKDNDRGATMNAKYRSIGFTLVELLVVIAIIAVLI